MITGFNAFAPLALDLAALAGVLVLGAFLLQNRRRYGRWVLGAPAAPPPENFLARVFHEQARRAHQNLSDLLHGEFEALHRLAEAGPGEGPGAAAGSCAGSAAAAAPEREVYAEAVRLAAGGAMGAAIVERLGLRQGEAQLVVNLERCAGRRV